MHLTVIKSRKIDNLSIHRDASVREALKRITKNKNRLIFTVNTHGVLEGVLSDGDFRNWLLNQATPDLEQSVGNIANKNIQAVAGISDPVGKIVEQMDLPAISMVPLVDQEYRLQGVAYPRTIDNEFHIGDHSIGKDLPTFIIAEIGNNHNGSLQTAFKLIEAAVESGADCAKFQLRNLTSLYRSGAKEDLGTEYTLDLLARFQLEESQLQECFRYCKELNIIPLCTPWDMASMRFLANCGMRVFKIASADLTNHQLLAYASELGASLICSTGMATEHEIRKAVELMQNNGTHYTLLHCNSTYPTPYKDVNLKYISILQDIGKCPVGYSGHERGFEVVLGSIALGADVIEKHITLDRDSEGNDHTVSLLPEEFTDMVRQIRNLESALGSIAPRRISQGELMNRENLAKSLVAKVDIQPGTVLTEEMIDIKSPGKGLQPDRKNELIGATIERHINASGFFYESDLHKTQNSPKPFSFPFKWGIPVRHHDFRQLLDRSDPKLLEFHLSYRDLELDHRTFFSESYPQDLVVHCPELFLNDHILDLSSPDSVYRKRSIEEISRVIEFTKTIRANFNCQRKTPIVTNMGGFSVNSPFSSNSEKEERYSILADSLQRLGDHEEVELIAQTMPPFPWHFGGQRFHNLFVTPADTVDFCQKTGLRLCLDISHTALAANHHHHSLLSYVEKLAPWVIHMHIADATGVDGEGLQLGAGRVDFQSLSILLRNTIAEHATFIPEIWQGHKNDGEGFWIALNWLEKCFAQTSKQQTAHPSGRLESD